MDQRLSQLVPATFIARSIGLVATGLVIITCAYLTLFEHGWPGGIILFLAVAYPLLFLSTYLYLVLIYPVRELLSFPNRTQNPLLFLLSASTYLSAIALIYFAQYATEDLYILVFLLAIPAGSTSGLRLFQAMGLMVCANVLSAFMLLPQLNGLYFIQILSGQLLAYSLFDAMLNEFRQKTIANTNLAQLKATQNLLESRVEQETREAIARDLHDELGHLSTVISHNLSQYCFTYNSTDPLLKNAMDVSRKMTEQIRSLTHSWQEPVFDIKAALTDLASTIPRPSIEVDIEGFDGTCSANSGAILFRCCQELITNSIRHSNATQLQILIMKSPSRFSICIEDNGTGKSVLTLGKGLSGIRSRIQQLGGQIELALSNEGFRAQMMIPAL